MRPFYLILLVLSCAAVVKSPRQQAVQQEKGMARMVVVTNHPPPMPGQVQPAPEVSTFEVPAVQPQPTTEGNVTCFPQGYVNPKTGHTVTIPYCVTNNPATPYNGEMTLAWTEPNYPPQGPVMWTNVLMFSTNGGQTWAGIILVPVTNRNMVINLNINPLWTTCVCKFGTNLY